MYKLQIVDNKCKSKIHYEIILISILEILETSTIANIAMVIIGMYVYNVCND